MSGMRRIVLLRTNDDKPSTQIRSGSQRPDLHDYEYGDLIMSDQLDLSLVSISDYLKSRNITIYTEGKNVKDGWTNIRCLFCDDRSNHLGISPTGGFNCWRCPAKGTIITLAMKIDGCGFSNALKTLSDFKAYRTIHDYDNPHFEQPQAGMLRDFKSVDSVFSDEMISPDLFPEYVEYIVGRNFDPVVLIKKYGLYCGGSIGKYHHRIVVPFYQHGKKVTFTARDITGTNNIPYLHQPVDESQTHPKSELYNTDNARDTIIVVEGPTDVWRIGDGCVALCGMKYTQKQVLLLSQYKRVFIMLDAEDEAQRLARKLASNLSSLVNHVEKITLDEGDPGDMNPEDIKHLRSLVFGK